MKLVEKFILAAAKRIEAKQKKKAELELKSKIDINEVYKANRETARKIIDNFVASIELLMNNAGCHLKVGNTAILNLWELDYPCRNGWDTGPNEILRNVPVEVKRNPLKVRITDVYISRSYYDEMLDRFFNVYYGDHLKRALDEGVVVQWFIKFTQNNLWPENSGLYWEAKFEPLNFDFKPSWGLNAGSFLVEGTNGAIFTEKYWENEGKIQTKWEEINYEKKQFDVVLNKMLEKYKNNEI
jgi:hypothetical protein